MVHKVHILPPFETLPSVSKLPQGVGETVKAITGGRGLNVLKADAKVLNPTLVHGYTASIAKSFVYASFESH